MHALGSALVLLLVPSLAGAQVRWAYRAPTEARQTGSLARAGIQESSGLAASRAHSGVLWTIEDSGNPPLVSAIDTAGRLLGRWRLRGARNVDWEAVSVGPCGEHHCIYVGDTGDNAERRRSVTVYRFREPSPGGGSSRAAAVAPERLSLSYPDGPRDLEALIVSPDETLLLVSKGRSGGIRAYSVPRSAWSRAGRATATALGLIPLAVTGVAGQVTDAALAPDGRTVVLRTYAALHFFSLGPDLRLDPGPRPVACSILGLELQGEGVTWLDRTTLALSSEAAYGTPGTISRVRCPLE